MYCKNCGQKIEDDSKFCNHCGVAQKSKTEAITDTETEIETTETKSNKIGCFTIFVVLFLLFAVCVVIVIANKDPKSSNVSSSSSSADKQSSPIENIITPKTRDARNSDIVVDFTSIPKIFSADTYLLELQSQEEITGLVITIDFVNASGRTLKTETLNIGKVVPGNKYSYELNQSGMKPDDVDTVSGFSCRVTSGTVVED